MYNNLMVAAPDVFPSAKGATTRLALTLEILRGISKNITFLCYGTNEQPTYQMTKGIFIKRFKSLEPDPIKKGFDFSEFVWTQISKTKGRIDAVHFRDPWSGYSFINHPYLKNRPKIYEVNAFPSIELPCHNPTLLISAKSILNGIKKMELSCLKSANKVITVSPVNKRFLLELGTDEKKIFLVPNAGDFIDPDAKEPVFDHHHSLNTPLLRGIKENFILYAGTLAPWQGVHTALEAFSLLSDQNLLLILVCSTGKYLSSLKKKICSLGIEKKVMVKIGLSRSELRSLYQKALLTLCPLTRGDRNEVQGCCPIKILESMAEGTPVIASDLAVTRYIISHGEDGLLVSPESERALAKGILTAVQRDGLLNKMSINAPKKIERLFSSQKFRQRLERVYHKLMDQGKE